LIAAVNYLTILEENDPEDERKLYGTVSLTNGLYVAVFSVEFERDNGFFRLAVPRT
jgi:hypothetical protein